MSFDTLLVANRGEIARRVIRGAHEMGIRCVAVYLDADADAPVVQDADESVRLATSYLDGAAILQAALATGAGAVHPGYGFLSENAEFAAQVSDAGLAWVGLNGQPVVWLCSGGTSVPACGMRMLSTGWPNRGNSPISGSLLRIRVKRGACSTVRRLTCSPIVARRSSIYAGATVVWWF